VFVVAMCVPGGDFICQGSHAWNAPIEALE